jgi:hypothetical protein
MTVRDHGHSLPVIQTLHRELEQLRALFDTKLTALHVEITTVIHAEGKALEKQALEYERRLHELNNAHRQATERYALFLPREMFEAAMKEMDTWRRGVDVDRATNSGQRAAYLSIFSAMLSLLTLFFVAYGLWR